MQAAAELEPARAVGLGTIRPRTVLHEIHWGRVTCPTCRSRDFCLTEGLDTEALSEFERVVHEVQEIGVTPEELVRAKTYLEGALDIGMQGTSQRTAVYGLGQLHHGKWNAFQDYIENMRAVSGADVQRVAQSYLNSSRSVRVILRAQR